MNFQLINKYEMVSSEIISIYSRSNKTITYFTGYMFIMCIMCEYGQYVCVWVWVGYGYKCVCARACV